MSLSILTIADAFKDLLNSSAVRNYLDGRGLDDHAYNFEAERIFHPVLELKQYDALKVFVLPAGRERDTDARVADKIERRVTIAVKKRFKLHDEASELEQCDGLVKFVEALEDFFAGEDQRQITVAGVELMFDSLRNEQLWSPAQLRKFHQFSSGFTLQHWTLE